MNIEIGGEVTSKDVKYLILDLLNLENKNYMYCITENLEKKLPAFLEYKIEDDRLKVKVINDKNIIEKLTKIEKKNISNDE